MKKLLSFVLMASCSSSAFAMYDLHCSYSGVKNPYTASFNKKNDTAQVKVNNESVKFGDLKCTETKLQEGLIYNCISTGVNDAGFALKFFWEPDEDFTVDVYEQTFTGEKFVTTLPCWTNF